METDLTSKFPKHELELQILPGPRDDLFEIEKKDSSDNFQLQEIKKIGLAGFFLKQLPEEESAIEDYDLNRTVSYQKAFPVANIFIPTIKDAYIDRIIAIKQIGKINVEEIKKSISDQANKIETKIQKLSPEGAQLSAKIPIIFALCAKTKQSAPEVEKLRNDLNNYFEKTVSEIRPILQIRVVCVSNNSKEITRQSLFESVECCKDPKGRGQNPPNPPNPLLMSLILNVPDVETRFEITRRMFRIPPKNEPKTGTEPETQITLRNVNGVLSLFRAYFPQIEGCLETLPEFNRIRQDFLHYLPEWEKQNNLNGTKNDNSNDKSKPQINLYLGEIKDFWEKVVSSLDCPRGLLIHGYKRQHLNQVLRQPFNCDFEFDWLLVGNGLLTIFEVGRSDNPELPKSAVENKLAHDKVLKAVTKMQNIVFSILKEVADHLPDTELKTIAEKSVRFVVVFPNTTKAAIQALIDEKKIKAEKLTTVKNNRTLILTADFDQVELESNTYCSNGKLKLFELSADFQLMLSGITTDDLFSSEAALYLDFNEEHKKLISYVAAILSLSVLLNPTTSGNDPTSCDTSNQLSAQSWYLDPPDTRPLNVEERLISRVAAKKDQHRLTQLEIILSPQQRSLLDENPDRICLIGEPGTRKTSVLMMKAFDAALHNENVKYVIISFPSEKTDFKEFIVKFFENQNVPDEAKNKFRFLSIEELASIVESQNLCKILNEVTKKVLLVVNPEQGYLSRYNLNFQRQIDQNQHQINKAYFDLNLTKKKQKKNSTECSAHSL